MFATSECKTEKCIAVAVELEQRLESVQEELDALRTEFNEYAYMVSHDLAAPFRQIQGFANIILENQRDQFDDKTKRHFDNILKGSAKGSRIVGDLLSFSQLSTRALEISEVNCNHLIAEVSAELSAEFQETKIEYSAAEAPVVEGDVGQLRTLFYELMHNAVLYQQSDSQAHVSIQACENQHSWGFRIVDNGIGISTSLSQKVFTVLKRGVGDKEYPGSGMGLAVARRIVQHHGGTIDIESNEEGGCTVNFTLLKKSNNDHS